MHRIREVLRLKHECGLSHETIARALGIAKGPVANYVAAAQAAGVSAALARELDWIAAHVAAFEYFGGSPVLLVPDNARALITKPNRYEPETHRAYEAMAEHYGCAVLPARPRKPRDKASVEAGVLLVSRWILARLRDRRFFSLAEVNAAIAPLLDILNDKPFQKLQGSRRSWFDLLERPVIRALPEAAYEYAQFNLNPAITRSVRGARGA